MFKGNFLKIFIFVLIVFPNLFCGDSSKNEFLARVNDDYISVDEFTRKLKYFTRLTGIKDNLQTRETLLDQIINERLLIQDFRQRGFTNSPEYNRKLESIQTQFYLDAFRRQAFYDTISVSEKEMLQKFKYYNQKVSARHLYARTESEANDLYQKLQQGATFDELAKITFQDQTLASNGGYLGYFGKGEMDPEFERIAFSQKIGDISRPVKTQYGYSIIKVEDRFVKPFTSQSEFVAAIPKLEKIIKKEKSIASAQDYGNRLARNLDLKFNEQIIQFLIDKLHPNQDSPEFQYEPELLPNDELLDEIKNENLVSYKNGEWTVEKYFDRVRFTSKRQRNRVKNSDQLKQFIKGLIVREELVAQAIENGVDDIPEVQYEIDHAIEGYIVNQMRSMILDTATVPIKAAREIFNKDSASYVFPPEANVREILVSDEGTANEILSKLADGESFENLARIYSERQWARDRGGELGMAPRSKYGALADTIFSLQPGDVIGPIEIEGYYSIIQMIEKRPGRQKSFEQARSQIETEQLWMWRKIRLHNYIDDLRNESNIEIDEDNLRWLVVK